MTNYSDICFEELKSRDIRRHLKAHTTENLLQQFEKLEQGNKKRTNDSLSLDVQYLKRFKGTYSTTESTSATASTSAHENEDLVEAEDNLQQDIDNQWSVVIDETDAGLESDHLEIITPSSYRNKLKLFQCSINSPIQERVSYNSRSQTMADSTVRSSIELMSLCNKRNISKAATQELFNWFNSYLTGIGKGIDVFVGYWFF